MSPLNISSNQSGCHDSEVVESGGPIPSALMFSAGVVGDIVALVLLEARRRRRGSSLYHILVTALLMTDLLGTISVSPLVLCAYGSNKSLVGMSEGKEVCSYFGFSMTFLSVSTLAILCALALERCFSIIQPYFYERHLSKRSGYIIIALIYAGGVLFCVPPLMGYGVYVQYCPGTWCFLEMSPSDVEGRVYMGFYASFILIVTSCTVLCNIAVISYLVMMHRRRKVRRSKVAHSRYCRSLSMTEEVEHLLPLTLITVVFICCTLPLVLRVYINFLRKNEDHQDVKDLGALRLLSFHSIINPWVFIILRPSILKVIWRKMRKPQEPTVTLRKTPNSQSCCPAPERESG
ncbi:prostaglandin E receptor 2b subtype EP2 [Aulostomus maculatus]